MMFVEKLYNEIRLYINQGQSQYFSPEEVMTALNRAQIDKYKAAYSIFENTQVITDAMRNFKKTSDLTMTAAKVFDLPDDYFDATNISALVADPDSTPQEPLPDIEYSGKLYTDGEWLDAKESELLPPTVEDIKARIVSGAIQALPATQNKIRLYYLKKPVDAVYAYDIVNDQIVFKEQGSIDPEWPESEFTDLITRSITYLGISMKDAVDIKIEEVIGK